MTRMSFYLITLFSLPLSALSGDWTPSLVAGGVTLAAVFVADVAARLREASRLAEMQFEDPDQRFSQNRVAVHARREAGR